MVEFIVGLATLLISIAAFAGFMVCAERSRHAFRALLKIVAALFWATAVLAAGFATFVAISSTFNISKDYKAALYLPGALAAMAALQYVSNIARRWAGLSPQPPFITGDGW